MENSISNRVINLRLDLQKLSYISSFTCRNHLLNKFNLIAHAYLRIISINNHT